MRKTRRKLMLHRETLRALSRRELALAEGRAAQNPTETCPYSGCFVCSGGLCTLEVQVDG